MIFQVAKAESRISSNIMNSGSFLRFVKCLILVLLTLCFVNPALANRPALKHFNSAGNTQQDLCGVSMTDSVTGYIKSASSSQIFYLITITNTGANRDSFNLIQKFVSGINLYAYIETTDGKVLMQSPGINPGGSYSFVVRFVTPTGTQPNTLNFTDIIATSLTCQATATTHITTHVYGGKPPTGDSCDLSINKTANLNPVTVGDTLIYTISVINSLSGSAKDVFVIDTLASSLQYITSSVSAPSANYSLNYSSANNSIQFKYLTSLALNQIITITIKVKVKCQAVPSVVNRAIVSSSSYDNNATNDNSAVTTTVKTNLSAPFSSGITSCYNSTAGLTASGATSGYGYKWYNISSGGTPLDSGSVYTTAALITTTTYYVAFYNLSSPVCEGPRTSVIVNVQSPPSITSSPSAVSVCAGNNATFSVKASGASLSYEWQLSTDNGSSWSTLSNSATYAGTATSILIVANVSSALNGCKYRCNVRNAGCAYVVSSSAAILTVRAPYTWLGVNTNWEDSQNWCQGVPDSSSDVTIPSGLSYYPVIGSGTTAVTKNIYIGVGASVTFTSGGILQIYGDITNYGLFDATKGTIEMAGAAPQTIAGSMFYQKSLLNLIVSNSSSSGLSVSSTANDTLKVYGTLSFGRATSQLNTGDNLTLVSNALGTARVDIVGTGNAINGKVIVERYINLGTAPGQHAKSWQFLSTPTTGQSVKESWMENGNTPANYGTQVTGAGGIAAGFDKYTATPSLKYYDYTTNNWIGITNTNNPVYNANGYMIFVRGDRTVTAFDQPPVVTTLRTKGTLLTGTQQPISVNSNSIESAGNPYASPIDFTKITKSASIDNMFYAWDPYLSGMYGLGGYQTLSSTNNWEPVPGGTTAYPAGLASPTIQSGQAFFVHSTDTSSVTTKDINTITFTENCKSAATSSINFARKLDVPKTRQFLRVSLYTGPSKTDAIADGNAAVFDPAFSNTIDGDDAIKFLNAGENFSLKRAGKLLSIEAKAPVSIFDTLYYYMSNLAQHTYQLRFAPLNMQSTGLQAFLLDKFLNTSMPLSLSDSSFVNITITANAASSAADRFKVVFRQLNAMPVTFTSIKAIQKDENILVEWSVENESGILQYEIEKSADGINFLQTGKVSALNKGAANYQWTDEQPFEGNNYYRIRSVSRDGKINYTLIVKVVMAKRETKIFVYPNPVTDGFIRLRLKDQTPGIYITRLFNSLGQLILNDKFTICEQSSQQSIPVNNLPTGIYQLEVVKPDGNHEFIKIIN
jgi:uncharacterized repeat protein (TIGR01451 family)